MHRASACFVFCQLSLILIAYNSIFKQVKRRETEIYIGIFAAFDNFDRREAQRETWLLSSKFKHKFLIDNWTPEWELENKKYGDIISLNSSFTGYAYGFGDKLYRWFKYAKENFPEGSIVGKSDDDFYACSNLYEVVFENTHPRMYLGWWHFLEEAGELKMPNKRIRVDSQFVLIGWELLLEVLKKPYCHPSIDGESCNLTNPDVRYDTNSGGSALGTWLGHIGNIHGVQMNKRMAHTKAYESKATFNEYRDPTTKPYCGEMVSYHKATPELQRYLECYDQDIPPSKIFCSKAENMTSYDLLKSPKKGKT